MKKLVLFFAALICLMMQTTSIFAKDEVIPIKKLPMAAMEFVQNAFPGQAVSYAKLDKNCAKKTYEVCLNNGVEVEFDKSGTWDKIDCNHHAIPEGLIPTIIAKYVKAHYAGNDIVKIKKGCYGYDVELSNNLELMFDQSGKLTEIED